jgi:AraC family transcriptional regulator
MHWDLQQLLQRLPNLQVVDFMSNRYGNPPMTNNLATTATSDQVSLRNLLAQLSGLLGNCAEPAEQRVQRADALLRNFPMQQGEAFESRDARPSGPALLAWQIKRLVAYIESHIESPISIQELASIAGLSPSHFCRAFRRSLKESPHCFVMQRRIARSQALMSTTRAPLSHIAIDCGFADQAHFSRVHRKLVGMAPGIWRRMRPVDELAAA